LVIDDEAHIRRVISLKLKNKGFEVMTAVDGEEGLNIIQTKKPDVVISDILMPKLDGQRLCEKTNHLKSERPFLTIVMTCRISTDESEWIERMRDTLFMEKPFSPSKLIEAIDRYFETGKNDRYRPI
jgi:DNA-binding NtrC family response regulator